MYRYDEFDHGCAVFDDSCPDHNGRSSAANNGAPHKYGT